MGKVMTAFLLLLVVAAAQTYKCERCVIGIGGGDMVGAYHSSATIGQTAVGRMTGTSYGALIGFWQPETPTGIDEQRYSPNQGPLATRLYSPFPSPAVRSVTIQYTLDAQRQTLLQVHDLTGRVVRTLCASSMKSGAYSVTWDGRDLSGRSVANGVYFCRFSAGGYHATEKLVLQR